MRKFVLVAVVAFAALPAIALANGSSAHNSAEKQCRSEQSSMGALFKQTFGKGKKHSNAFGQCVSHRTEQNSSDEGQSQNRAELACRTERSTIGVSAFDAKYGNNKSGNDKNAFGKCVSSHAKSMNQSEENEQVTDEDAAATQCRSMQQNGTLKAAFGDKPNAFGKCVSKTSHEQESQQEEQQESTS